MKMMTQHPQITLINQCASDAAACLRNAKREACLIATRRNMQDQALS